MVLMYFCVCVECSSCVGNGNRQGRCGRFWIQKHLRKQYAKVCICMHIRNKYVILKAKDTVPLLVPGNLPTPETVVVEKVFACWCLGDGCYCCNGDKGAAGITVSFMTLIEKSLHRVFVHNNNTGDAMPSYGWGSRAVIFSATTRPSRTGTRA